MSDLHWPHRGLLSFVGLDYLASNDGKKRQALLSEAKIDPRTGGAVAVMTDAALDGKDGTTHIQTYYWYLDPSGRQQMQTLFDVELEPSHKDVRKPDGTKKKTQIMLPKSVWVLGRKVYDVLDDDHLLQQIGHSADQGVMFNLNRVMGALGEVNRQLRLGKLPEVAKIFDEHHVHDAIGEQLYIHGLSSKGGFNFDAADQRGAKIGGAFTVPAMVAPALIGLGANTLDPHHQLKAKTAKMTEDPKTGSLFMFDAKSRTGKDPKASTTIRTVSIAEDDETHGVPRLTDVKWHSTGDGQCRLKELNLLGEDITNEDLVTQMRSIGVTNQILRDLRISKEYPKVIDHLVEYDLHHLLDDYTPPPPLHDGGRLSMISLGGNNMQAIADGFGETIGGNCKVVRHEGLSKKGKADRVGVIVDLGLHLSPKDEVNLAAAPDVIEHLKYCDHILLTHRHLDHTDGIFAYIQYGYLKGKTVHATPEVIRALRDKLGTYPSIHLDDLPTFAPLIGDGWLHIKDKEGETRLAINYARNATPHSARCTPFFIHGLYKNKWLGSYLNHGDARFGPHNAQGYDGPEVDADHLNKAFFTQSNQRLLKEFPKLDPSIASLNPTYFDIDTTSITKPGWGPTEFEVESNLTTVSNWFHDKGILLAMISTNDNRLETSFRVATNSHRDMTVFGSNLEKSATTANVLGVNDLRQEPKDRGNIQHYLDFFFERRLVRQIEKQQNELEQTQEPEERSRLKQKIARNEARMEAFLQLKEISVTAPHIRYQMREELEAKLQEDYGRGAWLGAVIVGRTSGTARKIMEHPWRRLALLTGTQNTNSEVDAALSALAEGRHTVLDGNPENSHTVRPATPQNNVIIISQTAIPGNDKKQAKMVSKLASRGFTVVQATGDGFVIHNVDEAHRAVIEEELKALGKSCTREADGSLRVNGMPIHAGGHGHYEDCKAWVEMVKADVTAAQHTSDPKAPQYLRDIGGTLGQRVMERIVPNFEGISIRSGDAPAVTEITSIGKTMPSLIKIAIERRSREYHGGHIIATQVRRGDVEGGFRQDGMRASARHGGAYERAFATRDAEDAARETMARRGERPEPHQINRTEPHDHRPHRGPIRPGSERRGRVLMRALQPQPIGLQR